MKRVCAFALLCAAGTGVAGRAYAQDEPETWAGPEYTFEGHILRITRGSSHTVIDIGCAGRSALPVGTSLLVACGTAGVVEVDLSDPLSPRRVGTMPVDGDATGLFLHDGTAWVEIAHVDARPVSIETLGPGAAPTTPGPAPQREAGAPKRPIVTFRRRAPAPAQEDRPASDLPKESPSIVAPPRRGDLWEVSFLTGAFVAFGTLGVGQLGSASVAYRFESPIVLRAAIAPFGIAGPSTKTSFTNGFGAPPSTSSGGAITVFAAHLLVGLDTQFVEVGLGFGGATVNQNNAFAAGGTTPATGSVSIVEAARIGARDGLALNLETSAVTANSQFDLGYFVSSIQIPVSEKAMLVVRGGGGRVGFAYGDLGVRVLVRGDGGKGTIALTGFAGGAAIMVNLCSSNPDPPFASACNTSSLGGPSLGGAVEWKQ